MVKDLTKLAELIHGRFFFERILERKERALDKRDLVRFHTAVLDRLQRCLQPSAIRPLVTIEKPVNLFDRRMEIKPVATVL